MGVLEKNCWETTQFFVQLVFTARSAEAVVGVLEKLEVFPWAMPDARFKPHITLRAGEIRDWPALASSLQTIMQKQPAFELKLTSFGTFGVEGGILFLSPAYSRHLHRLFEQLHARLDSSADVLNPLYTPGLWTPHCTLLMGLGAPHLAQSIEALAGERLPLTLRAHGVELCAYPSLEVVQAWPLDL